MHDNTLTDDNRDKLIQIAERYGQILKFYNVEELCADGLAQIEEHFPQARESHFSIATFYRFFIPELLLPQGIEKAIYLDSDIIVNLDIEEFWQIELGDKPLGVVPEADNDVPVKEVALLVKEDVISEEIYFNAGILLMNLKVLREEEANILSGIKFIGEYPGIVCFDQDVLNYCFAASSLRLPIKFNFYVKWAQFRDDFKVENKICHYADEKSRFIMDGKDSYTQLFMDYFIKTPWAEADTRIALTGGLPSRKYYAVSVVIPMYNEEEFIGECLDSLLAQTFQAFEVIVVDDCSTDNSVEVVKGYEPKFNGRLKLEKTKKNSGGGGVSRNIGLMLARGEYVYFMDADDMILSHALESLYKAAVLYEAEVVYTSSWYYLNAPNDIYLIRDFASRKLPGIQIEFTIDNPNKNLSRLLLEERREIFNDSWAELLGEENNEGAWTKFVRRDLLIKNKIFFPKLPTSGDFIWSINLYCYVRRFLRISTPFYLYRRYNTNSIGRTIRPAQEQCLYWCSSFVDFAKALYELERENEILAENPIYRLAMLRKKLAWHLNRTEEARKELGSKELYNILNSEFAKISNDSSAAILPFLFSSINEKEDNNFYAELINKFKPFITARIDIKLMTTEGDFQILSTSDDKAGVYKPNWFQKDGMGYVINSNVGQLKFVAKTTMDGQI